MILNRAIYILAIIFGMLILITGHASRITFYDTVSLNGITAKLFGLSALVWGAICLKLTFKK